MASCEHKTCGSSEKVWLPFLYRGMECGLKPHPYCAECGLIKNLSSEKPRKAGFYINVISTLSNRTKISQAQMRLISQELDRSLDDGYGMDRFMQDALFFKDT